MPTTSNTKTFSIRSVTEKIFSVTGNLDGMPPVISGILYMFLRPLRIPTIVVTASAKLIKKFTTNISIPVTNIAATLSIRIPPYDTIRIPVPTFVLRLSQLVKPSATVVFKLPLAFDDQLIQKVSTALQIPTIAVTWSMLVGIFHKLSEYDTDTLSVLDVQTLGDLDATYY